MKLKIVLQGILDAVKKEDAEVGMSLVGKSGKLMLYKRREGTGKALGKEIQVKGTVLVFSGMYTEPCFER